MSKKKLYKVNLKETEKEALAKFVAQGKKSAREITRARILLLANEGKIDREIAQLLGVVWQTVQSIRKKFAQRKSENILDVLSDQPRSGRPIEIDSAMESKVTMIACSQPEQGSAKWTLRMIADKVVKLEYIDSISYGTVRKILKKTN